METLIWNAILTLVTGVVGFLWKAASNKVVELEGALKEQAKTITEVQIKYAHKDDLAGLKIDMNHRFDKLEEMINKKNA